MAGHHLVNAYLLSPGRHKNITSQKWSPHIIVREPDTGGGENRSERQRRQAVSALLAHRPDLLGLTHPQALWPVVPDTAAVAWPPLCGLRPTEAHKSWYATPSCTLPSLPWSILTNTKAQYIQTHAVPAGPARICSTNWKCEVTHSKGIKEGFFFLPKSLSWPVMVYFTCYFMGHSLEQRDAHQMSVNPS